MGVCQSAVNKGKTSLKGLCEDEAKFNEYMDTAFDKVDVDKNGYLEKEEVRQLVQDLVNKLKKDTNVPEEKVKFYTAILAILIDYLHKKDIFYREFTPSNIIIDKDGYLKVTAFHIEKVFDIKKHIIENIDINEYTCPEVLSDINTMDIKGGDWWNLGIIMFEMIYSITPFFTDIDVELKNIITNNELKFPKNPNISENLKDLISKLLNKKGEERLGYQNGFEDIKKHEFFKDYNFDQLLGKEKEPSYKPLINSILENNKKIEERFTYEDLKKCVNFN